jgi:CubicO group peptidase (beta-lactamase class C family)
LEVYADRRLFRPMGIGKYVWQYTPQKVVNTAGGLRLRSLDLAKYGQLYADGGEYRGKKILPKAWVEATFQRYLEIPAARPAFYGYLFWNTTYTVNGIACETFYASGNGGNKIYIFPGQRLVVVVTATAYNKPYAHPQVDRMMERHVLPAVLR